MYQLLQTVVVKDCYSTSKVVAEDTYGGVIGHREGSELTNLYYDLEASLQGEPIGKNARKDGIIEGKTSSEMMQQSTFTDWDFDSTWKIDEGLSYPQLMWKKEKVAIKVPSINNSLHCTAFPNPFTTNVNIIYSAKITGIVTFQLYSLSGLKLKSVSPLTKHREKIIAQFDELNLLKEGVYVVKF